MIKNEDKIIAIISDKTEFKPNFDDIKSEIAYSNVKRPSLIQTIFKSFKPYAISFAVIVLLVAIGSIVYFNNQNNIASNEANDSFENKQYSDAYSDDKLSYKDTEIVCDYFSVQPENIAQTNTVKATDGGLDINGKEYDIAASYTFEDVLIEFQSMDPSISTFSITICEDTITFVAQTDDNEYIITSETMESNNQN